MWTIQTARERRLIANQPLDCAYDWGHDEHSIEALRSGRRSHDMTARILMARTHTVRLVTQGAEFGFGHLPWANDPVGTIPAMPEETDNTIVESLHWPDIGQGQQAEQSVPADLEKALQELAEVSAYAEEDGLEAPSELAFANAELLLKAMYRISKRRFGVYPDNDGYIAIDARGPNNGIVVVMCGSDGGVLCLVTIDNEPRRARYSTARKLPDGFIREALIELGEEPVP